MLAYYLNGIRIFFHMGLLSPTWLALIFCCLVWATRSLAFQVLMTRQAVISNVFHVLLDVSYYKFNISQHEVTNVNAFA